MFGLLFYLITVLCFSYCYCYSYNVKKTSLFRHRHNRVILTTNMLSTTDISTLIICYEESSQNFILELSKVIAPTAIPIASAVLFFKVADDSTNAKVSSIEKSTKAQVDSIKAQIDSIEKSTKAQVDSIERLIIAIEKRIESDKRAT